MDGAAISAEAVSYKYPGSGKDAFVIKELSFQLRRGEFAAIVGHSGCGKSTLLSLVMGLIFPAVGALSVNGAPVKGGGTDRAIVFQDCSLFPWMTAAENVAFGVRQSRRLSRAESQIIAEMTLDMAGLCSGKDKYPAEMSGGMRQKTAIARLLAMDSDIWLFDEPFSALDPDIRRSLQTQIMDLAKNKTEGKSVLFVTHNIDEALLLSERVLFMDNGAFSLDLPVPFAYPRTAAITQTKEYFALSDALSRRFYESRPKRK